MLIPFGHTQGSGCPFQVSKAATPSRLLKIAEVLSGVVRLHIVRRTCVQDNMASDDDPDKVGDLEGVGPRFDLDDLANVKIQVKRDRSRGWGGLCSYLRGDEGQSHSGGRGLTEVFLATWPNQVRFSLTQLTWLTLVDLNMTLSPVS